MEAKEFSDAILGAKFDLERLKRGKQGPDLWKEESKGAAGVQEDRRGREQDADEECDDPTGEREAARQRDLEWIKFEHEMYRNYERVMAEEELADSNVLTPRKFLRQCTSVREIGEYDSEEERKENEYFASRIYEAIDMSVLNKNPLRKVPERHPDLQGMMSVRTLMEANLAKDELSDLIHRISIVFRYNNDYGSPIHEAFDFFFSQINENYEDDQLSGNLLFYETKKVAIHTIEGIEPALLEYLIECKNSFLMNRIEKCKIFTVAQHVGRRMFVGLTCNTVQPPPPPEDEIPELEGCPQETAMNMVTLAGTQLMHYWAYVETSQESILKCGMGEKPSVESESKSRLSDSLDDDDDFDYEGDIEDDQKSEDAADDYRGLFGRDTDDYGSIGSTQKVEQEDGSDEKSDKDSLAGYYVAQWAASTMPSPDILEFALDVEFLQPLEELTSMFDTMPVFDDPEEQLVPNPCLKVPYNVMSPFKQEDEGARAIDPHMFGPPPRDPPQRRDDVELIYDETIPSPPLSYCSAHTMADAWE